MIIAVDFDGTVSLGQYPDTGPANIGLIQYLRDRKRKGDKMGAYYQAEKFNKILRRVSESDLFDIDEDGVMSTIVHTGGTMEAFRLRVEFLDGFVVLTTHSFMGVEDRNYERIMKLTDSINSTLTYGRFYVDEEKRLSFVTVCELENLEWLDNPFDVVFLGCETFDEYTEYILKVLTGSDVFALDVKR